MCVCLGVVDKGREHNLGWEVETVIPSYASLLWLQYVLNGSNRAEIHLWTWLWDIRVVSCSCGINYRKGALPVSNQPLLGQSVASYRIYQVRAIESYPVHLGGRELVYT